MPWHSFTAGETYSKEDVVRTVRERLESGEVTEPGSKWSELDKISSIESEVLTYRPQNPGQGGWGDSPLNASSWGGSGALWSQAEMSATVTAYIEMWTQERDGVGFVKADVIAKLREGPLQARSKGSVKYRLQNISAVFEQLGITPVSGYRALGQHRPSGILPDYPRNRHRRAARRRAYAANG